MQAKSIESRPTSLLRPVPRVEEVELSLVAPVRDERDNLGALHQRVCAVFDGRLGFELILVDDASVDGSRTVIADLGRSDRRVRPLFLAEHCGQTTALRVGIEAARAPIVATLDADLQNDPADLPRMLELLQGCDAVVGFRVGRRDGFVRRASSRIANGVRNALARDSIRDTGCSLKVFRAHAVRALPLQFEGMHRFMPTLLRYHGFEVREHPVSHRPRRAGRSKYGVANRALRAFRDLLAVCWMRSRIRRARIVAVDDHVPRAP
jgi:glycosyltransferase involved in cell wall biosynthesis